MFIRSTTISSIYRICRFYILQWTWNKRHTKSPTSASYLDVLLNIDATKKTNRFIVFNFDILSTSVIPLAKPHHHLHITYISISQLIWYASTSSTYNQCLSRGGLLTDKLMIQGFLQSCLMSAFRKFYVRYNDLILNYKLSLSHMLSDIFQTNS
jgi:hypothetical protein